MDIDKLINKEKKRHDSNMSFLKRQKTIFEKSKLRTDK